MQPTTLPPTSKPGKKINLSDYLNLQIKVFVKIAAPLNKFNENKLGEVYRSYCPAMVYDIIIKVGDAKKKKKTVPHNF